MTDFIDGDQMELLAKAEEARNTRPLPMGRMIDGNKIQTMDDVRALFELFEISVPTSHGLYDDLSHMFRDEEDTDGGN